MIRVSTVILSLLCLVFPCRPVFAQEPVSAEAEQSPPPSLQRLRELERRLEALPNNAKAAETLKRVRELEQRLSQPNPEGSASVQTPGPTTPRAEATKTQPSPARDNPATPQMAKSPAEAARIQLQRLRELERRLEALPQDAETVETLKQMRELEQRLSQPNPEGSAPVQTPTPALPHAEEVKTRGLSPQQLKRLGELRQRLNMLEFIMAGQGSEHGLSEHALGWRPELGERGFFLRSLDGNFDLRVAGGIQVDERTFPVGQRGTDPGTEPSTFEARRVRPIFDYRLAKEFRGEVMLDFVSRNPVFNAFLDWDRYEWARIRIGLFKPAFSLEDQQGEFDLVFAERSLVQNLAARRTFGANLTGRTLDKRVRYDIGVMNNNNGLIGLRNRGGRSDSNDKLGMVRVLVQPFLLEGPKAFRNLDMGVAVLFGSCTQTPCQQPMLTPNGDRIIFQYNPTITGNGFTTRIMPQMRWFWKRLGVMANFIHTWEPKIDRATGRATTLQNEAWMVQAEVALTDDEPAFNRLTPKKPFDLLKPGHWGAVTVAGRYAELRVDPKAFGFGFTDPAQFAQTAKGIGADLTWYLTREFRAQFVYEHTFLRGISPAFITTNHSDSLIIRSTLMF